MENPQLVAVVLGIFALIPTIASITRFDSWWVRGFDFPRLQISVITLFIILLVSLSLYVLVTLLVLSFFYQAIKIYPYTFFAKKQVLRFRGDDDRRLVSVLVSNVLTTNKKYEKLLNLVRRKEPDLLLTLETDKVWEEQLSVLEKDYPYSVKIPQDNLYGMHLYSRLQLEDIQVQFLVTEEIPSIHPKPPSPTEDLTSTNRDAELLQVGKKISGQPATLVIGDLNDVAWSRTTALFQKLSGLLDPRIGRGFYNTFHTGYPVFRWPLDHVFHTGDFSLIELRRLPHIGSDHFPIYIKLNYEPRIEDLQEKPEAVDEEEEEWVEEKIQKCDPGPEAEKKALNF